MSVLNKKGAQPRNREIKGKPFAWPATNFNNFNWVLPIMPKGFPLKNPKILRIFYNVYDPLKDDDTVTDCEEKAIRSCELRHPGEAAGCSMPPDVTNVGGNDEVYMYLFPQAMANFKCVDNIQIDVFDGVVFKHTTSAPTAKPDPDKNDFLYIESIESIVQQLKAMYQEKYFVEARSIEADEAIDLCTPKTELETEIGGYGPWVFNIFFIQNKISNPGRWTELLTRYTQQREPVDRWTKYHTEMGFNIYKSGVQQFEAGVSFSEDIASRQESWNVDQSPLVGFKTDFVINTFPTPYDRPSAETLGVPYILDYYVPLIDNFFETPS